MSKQQNTVRLTGTIEEDVHEALEAHCRSHPEVSRSSVMARALRRFLFPEHQEERERMLTENFDRLYWHQHNHADRVDRELRMVREMLALFVRTFYNHTAEIPPGERRAAKLSGEVRFDRFLKALAENVGPGKSALERMPEPGIVTPEEAPDPGEEGAGKEEEHGDSR